MDNQGSTAGNRFCAGCGAPLLPATGSSASSAIPRSSCLRGRIEPTRFEVSPLRLHSSPNRKARMEVDDGYDRKRQYRGDLSTVRKQVLADHRYTGLLARRIESPQSLMLAPLICTSR